jgi:SOS response regulatory protein OraA/RecX
MPGPENSKTFFIMENNSKAYSYLIKLLSARDYSEHKLKEKLREKVRAKKFTAEEGEAALKEVIEKGYLREEVYAEARVKAFMHKGYSPDYIRQKLSQEHMTVTNDDIGEVFTEYSLSPEDQIERLARKKLRSRTEIDFKEEGKILRFLISKGHDFGMSKKILKTILLESKEQ